MTEIQVWEGNGVPLVEENIYLKSKTARVTVTTPGASDTDETEVEFIAPPENETGLIRTFPQIKVTVDNASSLFRHMNSLAVSAREFAANTNYKFEMTISFENDDCSVTDYRCKGCVIVGTDVTQHGDRRGLEFFTSAFTILSDQVEVEHIP